MFVNFYILVVCANHYFIYVHDFSALLSKNAVFRLQYLRLVSTNFYFLGQNIWKPVIDTLNILDRE